MLKFDILGLYVRMLLVHQLLHLIVWDSCTHILIINKTLFTIVINFKFLYIYKTYVVLLLIQHSDKNIKIPVHLIAQNRIQTPGTRGRKSSASFLKVRLPLDIFKTKQNKFKLPGQLDFQFNIFVSIPLWYREESRRTAGGSRSTKC